MNGGARPNRRRTFEKEEQMPEIFSEDLRASISSCRMGATVTEADSSHLAMLSKPNLAADVIIKAANSAH